MRSTQPITWLNQTFEGYVVVNVEFSDSNKHTLGRLMQDVKDRFGAAVACAPVDSLHITLLDWLAPLVDYDGRDKTALYTQLRPKYDAALTDIIAAEKPFSVRFDTVKVSPTTIYIVGKDDGQFARIRSKFLEKIDLLPGTKLPSTIVHSSLIRFTEEINLDEVERFVDTLDIQLTHDVSKYTLIRAIKGPMLEYEVLKEYSLS